MTIAMTKMSATSPSAQTPAPRATTSASINTSTSGPIVLLHGFTGQPSSWDRVRQNSILDFAESHHWIFAEPILGHDPSLLAAPDLPPAALDEGAGFLREIDRLAARIASRITEHVAVHAANASTDRAGERIQSPGRGVHLVGYSLGARLALGLLVRHPSRFARATLVSCNPGIDPAERPARIESDERLACLLETEGIAAFVEHWASQPLFASQARLPEEIVATHRARRLAHAPAGLALALRHLGLGRMPDLRPALDRITVPVALVVGAEDHKFRALAERMAARLRRARVITVDGAGHDPTLERPDAVAAAIAADLQEDIA